MNVAPRDCKVIIRTDWRKNPDGLEVEGEIFAIGDVHGQNLALRAVLDEIADEPSDPAGREIIFTGDLIDRGPDNVGAVRTAFGAHAICDRLTVLPGNHEMMLADAGIQGSASTAFALWFQNGGRQTLRDMIQELPDQATTDLPASRYIDMATTELTRVIDGEAAKAGLSKWLHEGVTHRLIAAADGRKLLFVHAGVNPASSLEECLGQDRLKRTPGHWAWIREPFLQHTTGFKHLGVDLVVHGHTVAVTSRLADYLLPDANGNRVRPADLAEEVADRIDLWHEQGRICLDICAMAYGQVAALQIKGEKYRFIMSC